jgi:serine protease Do
VSGGGARLRMPAPVVFAWEVEMRACVSFASGAVRGGSWPRVVATFGAAAMFALLGTFPQAGRAQARELPDFADLVERVGPAVVNIRTSDRAAEGARAGARRGEASGFIISADGFVLTNTHVVNGAAEVSVTLTDKREFKATIVGADERTDVALLKLEASGLPVMRIGDAARLRVGEWVVAIGSPFGLDNTVTAGIVSAKQRDIGSDTPLIQTDVVVNPGNSGGPLINIRGEVVGINSMGLGRQGTYIGVSFAIPIDEAMRVVEQLKATGRVVRGFLGIVPADVPGDIAEEYGFGKGKPKGAFISQVVRGGPADKAGIRPGDVVLSVNGKAVEGGNDLRRTLGAQKPGTTVTLQVNRGGKSMEFKSALADRADLAGPAERADAGAAQAGRPWGLAVSNLTDADRTSMPGVAGVRVTAVSGGAEAAGVRPGDVIQAVGAAEVTDVKQFESAVGKFDRGRAISVIVRRGEWSFFVRIPVLK